MTNLPSGLPQRTPGRALAEALGAEPDLYELALACGHRITLPAFSRADPNGPGEHVRQFYCADHAAWQRASHPDDRADPDPAGADTEEP